MRLHTNLDAKDIYSALEAAKIQGNVTMDVMFVVFSAHGSRTNERAFELQLGTYEKDTLPTGTVDQYGKAMRVRRYKNSGQYGADSVYSATYFEWGWLMLEIFSRDPNARWGGLSKYSFGYHNVEDFHEKTDGRFL